MNVVDSVDVDTTPRTPERPRVLSTEPGKPTPPPVVLPAVPVPRCVDKTPELPKKSKVSSTSTLSAPTSLHRTVVLDPDRPGPTDILTHDQPRRYQAAYRAHNGTPEEKHAAAWRAAPSATWRAAANTWSPHSTTPAAWSFTWA